MRRKFDKRFFRNESGAVAATYALALVPLIALAGLGFDYARLVGMDTELQNAADQAALAGATQLDRQAGSMERAINAIKGGLVTNSTLFSNDSGSSTVEITNETTQICFYASKAEAEAGDPSTCFTDTDRYAEARFVQVTVDTRDANYALTPIVGAIKGSLNAEAVAGLGSALCRIPPLMICNPYESENPLSEEPFDFDAAAGRGLLVKPGGGSKWTPGNYGYLDIGTNGASGIREALGWNSPGGECVSQDGIEPEEPGTVDTQTGNVASGPQAINTRFDVYSNQGCINDGTCSPAYNSRKDLMREVEASLTGNKSCDIDSTGWQEPPNAYHPTTITLPIITSTSPKYDSMGHPRDVCHAVEDTNPDRCTSGLGNGVWDRDSYFWTHYGWLPSEWLANLSAATDLELENSPSISNISRYDVYKWEEKSVTRLANTPSGATGNQLTTRNTPVCAAVQGTGGYPTATDPFDRRRMTVAVINCNYHNVKGDSPNVPVETWADIFIVQPSYDRGAAGKFTKKDEIYAEIIGETDITRVGAPIGPTVRRDVPYLVR